MSFERFTELAAAYGASRERWPESERALHDRFAASAAGLAVLADAERVDRFLDGWQPSGDDAGRIARIMAAAEAHEAIAVPPLPRQPRPGRRRGGAWLSGGLAASALLGFVLGFAQVDTGIEAPGYTELLLVSSTLEDAP